MLIQRIASLALLSVILIASPRPGRAAVNLNGFAANLDAVLGPRTTGYSYAIVKDGNLEKSNAGGIARPGQNFAP